MMSRRFAYSRLEEHDHIRLLLLRPAASRNEGLAGSLRHISLNDHHRDLIDPYTALSYVWGEPMAADAIRLDGLDVGITANLGAALRDLRDTRRTHRVWADALCIDQDNMAERSQQVALMEHIYSRANSTVIYLGSLTPGVEVLLREVGLGVSIGLPGSDADRGPSDAETILDAARRGVLTHGWFARVWVLQELVLSREPWVQFGSERMRWHDLCRLLIPLLQAGRQPWDTAKDVTVLESMNSIRTEYWKGHHAALFSDPSAEIGGDHGNYDDGRGGRPRRLWRILNTRKHCGATDPRDWIFAHLGIISDKVEASRYIRVDYTLTVGDVFTAAARYINRRAGLPSLLAAITPSRAADPSLASWVPSWGRQVPQGASVCGPETPLPTSHTSPDGAEAFPVHAAAKILHTSGVLPPPSSSPEDFRQRLEDYYQKLARSGRRDASPWDEFVDALTAAGVEDTAPDGLRFWPDHAKNESGSSSLERQVYKLLESYLFSKQWGGPQAPSRLALLNDGTVTLVPGEAASGDVVACLAWYASEDYGLHNPRAGYSALGAVVVRRCAPPVAAGFERDYVSAHVAAMLGRRDVGYFGVNEILFLHGRLVGVYRDKADDVLRMPFGVPEERVLALVDGWSAHDVAERLGRRLGTDGLSSGRACVLVLH
ncbi:heterokaryon incompatibility protein-domain-containing protein [Xylaria palmicola]|nr:heterokaryon incompatibility protein-domain-containing protein [Xylaria palmicola]